MWGTFSLFLWMRAFVTVCTCSGGLGTIDFEFKVKAGPARCLCMTCLLVKITSGGECCWERLGPQRCVCLCGGGRGVCHTSKAKIPVGTSGCAQLFNFWGGNCRYWKHVLVGESGTVVPELTRAASAPVGAHSTTSAGNLHLSQTMRIWRVTQGQWFRITNTHLICAAFPGILYFEEAHCFWVRLSPRQRTILL